MKTGTTYVLPGKEEKQVNMGFNTSRYDGEHWNNAVRKFKDAVERYGIASASWGVTGRTLHQILAYELADALPDYEFEIGYNYKCIARKRVQ